MSVQCSFEPGNVVSVKTTGVRMTVEVIETVLDGRGIEHKVVHCVWFDKQDCLHRDSFLPSLLTFEGL